jgi:NADH-quinone oxidoreductase subunit L
MSNCKSVKGFKSKKRRRRMYGLIVLWPLIGAIMAGFFGRKLGEEGAVRVTTGLVGSGAIMSMYGLYEVL